MTNYEDLSGDSRIWIYQSNRLFTDEEVTLINDGLEKFCDQWAAHGSALKSFGKVYFNAFVILFVDESQAGASGCSIDSSVAVVKAIMEKYNVDLLNRMIFSYKEGDQVQLVDRLTFTKSVQEGNITDDTIVFNNLVKNKAEFEASWEVKLADSWHKNLV